MANAFTYHGGGVLSKVRTDGERVYFMSYWYRGRRVTEKVGFVEELARSMVAARRRQIDEDPAYIPPPVKRKNDARNRRKGAVRFKVFAKEFRKTWAATKRSAKTFFMPMIDRMVKEFGQLRLDEITARRIQQFVARRSAKVG